MKKVRYLVTWFEVGAFGVSEPKFHAGRDYPVTDETLRHAARGIAEEVDVEEAAEPPAGAPAAPSEGSAEVDAAAPAAPRKRGSK